MFKNSIVSRTGQVWKVHLSCGLIAAAGAGMAYAQLRIRALSADEFTAIMLPSTGLGLASFAFACLSVRCPVCRARWFWMAVRSQHLGAWLSWLTRLPACPICHPVKEGNAAH